MGFLLKTFFSVCIVMSFIFNGVSFADTVVVQPQPTNPPEQPPPPTTSPQTNTVVVPVTNAPATTVVPVTTPPGTTVVPVTPTAPASNTVVIPTTPAITAPSEPPESNPNPQETVVSPNPQNVVNPQPATEVTPTQKPAIATASVLAPVIPPNAAPAVKKKMIEDFVNSAKDYISKHGKEDAAKEFNKITGAFMNGSTYMFMIDYSGRVLATFNIDWLVGKDQRDLKNEDGVYIVKELIQKAQEGGGWISFRWPDPITNKSQCKNNYVMPMAEGYLIGSGYYYPSSPKGCAPE